MKKKQHNDNRRKAKERTAEPGEKKEPKDTGDSEEEKAREDTEEPEASGELEDKETGASVEPEEKDPEPAEHHEFDEGMVEHLRLQTSLLEGREVSREETCEMLRRVMSQHSIAGESRRDYILRFLKEIEEKDPP